MICHAKLGAGGIETACITQIREFSRRGYKIYVLAESGFYAEKLKQIEKKGVADCLVMEELNKINNL